MLAGARNLSRACDYQQFAPAVLIALGEARQRVTLQFGEIQRLAMAHRDPAMASGSAVCSVPSASIGAPTFHRSSFGEQRPLWSNLKS